MPQLNAGVPPDDPPRRPARLVAAGLLALVACGLSLVLVEGREFAWAFAPASLLLALTLATAAFGGWLLPPVAFLALCAAWRWEPWLALLICGPAGLVTLLVLAGGLARAARAAGRAWQGVFEARPSAPVVEAIVEAPPPRAQPAFWWVAAAGAVIAAGAAAWTAREMSPRAGELLVTAPAITPIWRHGGG